MARALCAVLIGARRLDPGRRPTAPRPVSGLLPCWRAGSPERITTVGLGPLGMVAAGRAAGRLPGQHRCAGSPGAPLPCGPPQRSAGPAPGAATRAGAGAPDRRERAITAGPGSGGRAGRLCSVPLSPRHRAHPLSRTRAVEVGVRPPGRLRPHLGGSAGPAPDCQTRPHLGRGTHLVHSAGGGSDGPGPLGPAPAAATGQDSDATGHDGSHPRDRRERRLLAESIIVS